MRVLQIMAGAKNGGAELYSTDIMLSLHEAGLEQRIVMRRAAPRFAELAGRGFRWRPRCWPPPAPAAAPAAGAADSRLSTGHHPLLDAPGGEPGRPRCGAGDHRLVRRL
ncbi:hypothetical protein GT370_14120 [Acidocella sp. MX-AZ03]|uniref:hypothetical protein n=1 Tax=Acidocella sp. MX-AZ03 TaxID=2697363 RepID=UPI0022DD8495|nr:hypothetical protein [Acidocella sp. MX-AZ03]WBO58334.1 hypothetical protein GT370_14120 [Acidocella sp. MX-AZ03]